MDLGPGTDADLLQRALDGEPVSDAGVLELLAVLHAVSATEQAALAPGPAFVAHLRTRLLSDDLPIAASSSIETADDGPTEPTEPTAPATVLRIPARPSRLLAAAAAVVLVVAGALGGLSRQAAPGDLLYPIKQLLDRAAVELADSPLDQGLTHLAQAEQHIGEARDLIDRGAPSATDLSAAFDAAAVSTRSGKAILLDVYRSEHRPEALNDLADFMTRARPQVEAMRPGLPAAAVPSWRRLHDLLVKGEIEALRELAACQACGDRAAQARKALDALLLNGAAPAIAAAPATTAPASDPPATGIPTPNGQVTPNQPAVTLSAPAATLPGVGVTANLPSVGLTSTAVQGGGGGLTLPGVTATLPGATLDTSGITLNGPTVSGSILPTLP